PSGRDCGGEACRRKLNIDWSQLATCRMKDNPMQKITPFLWFDGKAEEAANFYVSLFKNSKIGTISRYFEGSPGPKGTVMTLTFELEGQGFTALNGGPMFT